MNLIGLDRSVVDEMTQDDLDTATLSKDLISRLAHLVRYWRWRAIQAEQKLKKHKVEDEVSRKQIFP